MYKQGDLITVVADPHWRWETPFKRFRKGETRVYKVDYARQDPLGRLKVRASIVTSRGYAGGHYYMFRDNEIASITPLVINLDKFM